MVHVVGVCVAKASLSCSCLLAACEGNLDLVSELCFGGDPAAYNSCLAGQPANLARPLNGTDIRTLYPASTQTQVGNA